MRKNIKLLLISMLFCLVFMPNAKALSCSNKDANDLVSYASYVKAKYDIVDNSKRKKATANGQTKNFIVPNFTFNITVYNVTDNIYLEIKNDVDDEVITVYNKDTKNNTYTFSNHDFGQIYNYTISILSNNPSCKGEQIRSINLKKPKYNAFSEYDECKGSKLSICQKFINTNKNITIDEFSQTVNIDNNETEKWKITDFLSKYKVRIILGLLLISILVALLLIIIIRKKIKKRKEEW